VKRAVPPRIHHVRAARHDRDGHTPAIQTTSVGRAVDPERQPADDRDAGSTEPTTECVGHLRAIRTRATCADDRDRRLVPHHGQHLDTARAEEHGGRI
jgi:hypothetical protein